MKIFKHKKDHKRFMYLHPLILSVLFDMQYWCNERNIPFKITSTVSSEKEDEKLKRVSSSHRTGRAFDMSVQGWDKKRINEFRTVFNNKYNHIAAISGYTNQPTLIVYHNSGHGDHFHVQIHSKYSNEIKLAQQNLPPKE